ncbi:MAG: PEGA domain-containing protein [Leptonema sp. (in: bacteria)]
MIKFLFIFIFPIFLYAQNQFCDFYFRISLIPFLVVYSNQKEYQESEKDYLSEGISKMIFSNLKEKFFIQEPPLILVDTNFVYGKQNLCEALSLARIELMGKLSEIESKISDTTNLRELESIKKKYIEKIINYGISKNFQAVLSGVIIVKEKELHIEIFYENLLNKTRNFSIVFWLGKENPYDIENLKKIQEVSQKIQKEFFKINELYYRINAKEEYQVYVNGISYGKNVSEIFLPKGNFIIEIYKENCKNTYNTKELLDKVIHFDCPLQDSITIHITSNPDNCDIFLDDAFLGQTPKEIAISKKIYRLRISKKNYQDQFLILDLTKNFQNKIHLNLVSENQKEVKTFVANWTYYDISFGFAVQSLIFVGGWTYANVQKEKALSSVRSNLLPTFFLNPFEINPEQFWILETARKKSLFWHRQAQMYGGLSIFSLVLSSYFFYKGIDLDIQNSPYKSLSIRFFINF